MAPVDPSNRAVSEPITTHEPGHGYVEGELLRQVARQMADGELDDRHAGTVALARMAARTVDSLSPQEKAYGRAQVLTAARGIFELLPKPERRDPAMLEGFQDAIRDETGGFGD